MGWKTLWKKEKLLIMRNFSLFHNVFRRLVLQTHKNQGLFGKGLGLHCLLPYCMLGLKQSWATVLIWKSAAHLFTTLSINVRNIYSRVRQKKKKKEFHFTFFISLDKVLIHMFSFIIAHFLLFDAQIY